MIELDTFNPNGTGVDNGNYFGLPFTAEQSTVVLLSVPWDVTASYGAGTSSAPDAIIGASVQLDLYDQHTPQMWRQGIGTIGINYSIQEKSDRLREDSQRVMKHLENGGKITDESIKRKVERVNIGSQELNKYVYDESKRWLAEGKIVGLVGGDHSTPFGLIKAVAEYHNGGIGVLHIDAHRDLRECYEGFEHSHASIMYNVATQIAGIEQITQVAVRDFCDSEQEFASINPKITSFDDYTLNEDEFNGTTWSNQCAKIVATLPSKVYVSFDIDGLSPDNCPNTGTPVAGGLSFHKALYLLRNIALSGRHMVGFDLCEVAPSESNEWDANVGARILYKLCNLSIQTKI